MSVGNRLKLNFKKECTMKKIKTHIILILLLSQTVIYGNSISDSIIDIKQIETINLFNSERTVNDTNAIKLKTYYSASKAVPYIYALGIVLQCVGVSVTIGEYNRSHNEDEKTGNTGLILSVSGGLISTFSPVISSIAASSSRNYLAKIGEDPGSHYCWAWWTAGIGIKIAGSLYAASGNDVILPTITSVVGESFYLVSISKSIIYTRSNYTKRQLNISLYPYKVDRNSIGLALRGTF